MKLLQLRSLKKYFNSMHQLFMMKSQILCTSSITTKKIIVGSIHQQGRRPPRETRAGFLRRMLLGGREKKLTLDKGKQNRNFIRAQNLQIKTHIDE